jgi:protein TonB
MAGVILSQHAAQSDPYFDISTAENRIGTELISFAGLNTYQAYQTNIWLKAVMTQLVGESVAKAGRPFIAALSASILPASGKCSAPQADYPIQAMRMNQQGVVDVGFSVTPDGHTSNLSVETSSGSPALDAAALAAVSKATCNVPAGTHAALPITFSMQGSM